MKCCFNLHNIWNENNLFGFLCDTMYFPVSSIKTFIHIKQHSYTKIQRWNSPKRKFNWIVWNFSYFVSYNIPSLCFFVNFVTLWIQTLKMIVTFFHIFTNIVRDVMSVNMSCKRKNMLRVSWHNKILRINYVFATGTPNIFCYLKLLSSQPIIFMLT